MKNTAIFCFTILCNTVDWSSVKPQSRPLVLCHLCALAGDTELESVRRVTGNIVSNQVSFLLKPEDNNAGYSCNASNNATTEPLVATVSLKVSCTYYQSYSLFTDHTVDEYKITKNVLSMTVSLFTHYQTATDMSTFNHFNKKRILNI